MKSVHTEQYREFRELMIAARKAAGLTQTELATQLGKPQSYVSKYERGERRLDVVEFLILADRLHFDPHACISRLSGKSPKRGAS